MLKNPLTLGPLQVNHRLPDVNISLSEIEVAVTRIAWGGLKLYATKKLIDVVAELAVKRCRR